MDVVVEGVSGCGEEGEGVVRQVAVEVGDEILEVGEVVLEVEVLEVGVR